MTDFYPTNKKSLEHKLRKQFLELFDSKDFLYCLDDFFNLQLPLEEEARDYLTQFFIHWCYFRWKVLSERENERLDPEDILAKRLLNLSEKRFTEEDKHYVESLENAHHSFYVFLEEKKSSKFVFKDLLLEDCFIDLKDLKGSGAVFGSLLTIKGKQVLEKPFLFKSSVYPEIMAFKNSLLDLNDGVKLTSCALREKFDLEIIHFFMELLRSNP